MNASRISLALRLLASAALADAPARQITRIGRRPWPANGNNADGMEKASDAQDTFR